MFYNPKKLLILFLQHASRLVFKDWYECVNSLTILLIHVAINFSFDYEVCPIYSGA